MQYIINNWWQLLLILPIPIFTIVGLVLMIRDGAWPILIPLILLVCAIFGAANLSKADTFQYKNKLTIEAPDYSTAAKLCFKKLNPVFTSEERGLEVIDICTNPVKGEVK